MTAAGSVDLGLDNARFYSAEAALVDLLNEAGLRRAVEMELMTHNQIAFFGVSPSTLHAAHTLSQSLKYGLRTLPARV